MKVCRKCRLPRPEAALIRSEKYEGRYVCSHGCNAAVSQDIEKKSLKKKNAELKRANSELIRIVSSQDEIIEKLSGAIKIDQSQVVYEPVNEGPIRIVPVILLSDLHIGLITDSYNTDIARSRLYEVISGCNSFIEEKVSSRMIDHVEVLLAGDYVEAIDHGQDQTEVMQQVLDACDIISSCLSLVKHKLVIRMVAGNHDRLTHFKRMPNTRPTERSYATIIGSHLAKYYETIVEGGYCHHFKILWRDCILHHGDGIKGGGGIGGVAPPLVRWHAKYQQLHRFEISFIGHFHSAEIVQNHIVANGCLCGDTDFTKKLGLKSSLCQTLCFIDEKYGLNSVNRVYVNENR